MIAEDGTDYGTAKRKAAKQILGNEKVPSGVMPDNVEIENEVRLYNELCFSDTQLARLLYLRKLALQMMEELTQFNPYLINAVLQGTASEHSDIYLQLFSENTKDVEIFLLNKNVNFEVSETSHFNSHNIRPIEMLSFVWKNEGFHLALYELDDLRGAAKIKAGRTERANIEGVRALINEN